MDSARIETYREVIGGIEVVDAAYADRLLNATIKMMQRHAQWREALEAHNVARTKATKNRLTTVRKRYRRSRWECWQVVAEAKTPPPV